MAKGEENVSEDEDLEQEPLTKGKKEHDISAALEVTGHFTVRYPNGLTLGVRLEAVPGTRGVHVDVVLVPDVLVVHLSNGLTLSDKAGKEVVTILARTRLVPYCRRRMSRKPLSRATFSRWSIASGPRRAMSDGSGSRGAASTMTTAGWRCWRGSSPTSPSGY